MTVTAKITSLVGTITINDEVSPVVPPRWIKEGNRINIESGSELHMDIHHTNTNEVHQLDVANPSNPFWILEDADYHSAPVQPYPDVRFWERIIVAQGGVPPAQMPAPLLRALEQMNTLLELHATLLNDAGTMTPAQNADLQLQLAEQTQQLAQTLTPQTLFAESQQHISRAHRLLQRRGDNELRDRLSSLKSHQPKGLRAILPNRIADSLGDEPTQ